MKSLLRTALQGSWVVLAVVACSTPRVVPQVADRPSLRVLARGASQPTRVLVFMHGYTGRAEELVGIASHVEAEGLMILFPEGNFPVGQGYGWWDIGDFRAQGDFRDVIPEGLVSASSHIDLLLTSLPQQYGVPCRCVVVAGFSQGAVLAMDAGLLADPPVAGIAAMGGTLVARPRWSRHWADAPPILMTHGRRDRVLPFRYADAFRAELEAAGAPLTFEAFAGEHEVTTENLASLAAFVERTTAGCR